MLIVSFTNTQQFVRVTVTMETALPQTSAPVILVGLEIFVESVIKLLIKVVLNDFMPACDIIIERI